MKGPPIEESEGLHGVRNGVGGLREVGTQSAFVHPPVKMKTQK